MSKQERGGWRGFLTPVVRIFLLVGTAMGCLFGLYLGMGVPPDEAANVAFTRLPPQRIALIVGVSTVAGLLLGTIIGLVVERAFGDPAADKKSQRWWSKKSNRSRR